MNGLITSRHGKNAVITTMKLMIMMMILALPVLTMQHRMILEAQTVHFMADFLMGTESFFLWITKIQSTRWIFEILQEKPCF